MRLMSYCVQSEEVIKTNNNINKTSLRLEMHYFLKYFLQ